MPIFEICLTTLVGNACIDAYESMENTEFLTGRELIYLRRYRKWCRVENYGVTPELFKPLELKWHTGERTTSRKF